MELSSIHEVGIVANARGGRHIKVKLGRYGILN